MYLKIFKLHTDLLKAMSHPKRLEIIQLLRDQTLSVGQIQQMLNLPQANLSQHLQILRVSGIVSTRKVGKEIFYRIGHKNFIRASDQLREILIERYKDDPIADEFTHKMSDLVPLVQDPVCGMQVSPKTASYGYSYRGFHYYFCASGCFEMFKKQPRHYYYLAQKKILLV